MRDPKRIDDFLKVVGDYWKLVPDWRFGQFISNLSKYSRRDIFFMEEEDLKKLMHDYFDNRKS